jgi:hypothetical protein
MSDRSIHPEEGSTPSIVSAQHLQARIACRHSNLVGCVEAVQGRLLRHPVKNERLVVPTWLLLAQVLILNYFSSSLSYPTDPVHTASHPVKW